MNDQFARVDDVWLSRDVTESFDLLVNLNCSLKKENKNQLINIGTYAVLQR